MYPRFTYQLRPVSDHSSPFRISHIGHPLGSPYTLQFLHLQERFQDCLLLQLSSWMGEVVVLVGHGFSFWYIIWIFLWPFLSLWNRKDSWQYCLVWSRCSSCLLVSKGPDSSTRRRRNTLSTHLEEMESWLVILLTISSAGRRSQQPSNALI